MGNFDPSEYNAAHEDVENDDRYPAEQCLFRKVISHFMKIIDRFTKVIRYFMKIADRFTQDIEFMDAGP